MLKKFFSKALLSVVMDKNAREKLDAIRGEAKQKGQETPPLNPEASAEGKKREMTPERLALIRNAMKVRQEQTKILDELNDEQKLKLYAAAMKAFNIEFDKKS